MTTKIDGPTWIAVAGLAIGWFGLNTLVATFGPVQNNAHFYDLPVILRDPRRLLTGVSDLGILSRIVFSLLCFIAIGAALAPRLASSRLPRVLSAAPFLLMLVCGVVLYVKSSTAHIEAPESMGRVGGLIARWANSAMSWSGDVVARHIAVGAGGYLAFLSSIYLAVTGMAGSSRSAPTA